jgi:hypothetical protein
MLDHPENGGFQDGCHGVLPNPVRNGDVVSKTGLEIKVSELPRFDEFVSPDVHQHSTEPPDPYTTPAILRRDVPLANSSRPTRSFP